MGIPEFARDAVANVDIESGAILWCRQPVITRQAPLLRLHVPGQPARLLADERRQARVSQIIDPGLREKWIRDHVLPRLIIKTTKYLLFHVIIYFSE